MRKKPRIFLTRRLPAEVMERLASIFDLSLPVRDRQLTRKEIIRGVRGMDGMVTMLSDGIGREVMDASPTLKIISNYAVGTNNIDLKAATARSIMVTNTPGVLTETTADLTWALILAVARRITEGERLVRRGRWAGWAPTQLLGRDVYGRTLGVIGMGRIGQAVARRASGFSMRVVYYSRRRLSLRQESRLGARRLSMDRLLKSSDFITLHLPLTPQTRHLIGTEQLRKLKPTAYLINTARGPVVDEAALVRALRQGRLAGAALDVFEREPRIARGLLGMDNVVAVPHLGSASIETRIRMGFMVLENLREGLRGQVPPHLVNPLSRG